MNKTKKQKPLVKEISPDDIIKNEANPRLFFRSEEMGTLMSSIKQYGVQVPITVFSKGKKFVLLDGERRWRCATKLNLKTIPALIHSEPSPLENILLMYNIHALREQWDYFTIASKLPDIIDLYKQESGKKPNEAQLSELTGLTKSQIHRCNFLLELPDKYKEMLKDELRLPKQQQQLSEDFFIEMERSLKTINTRLPAVINNPNKIRDGLIKKFKNGVIGNVTDFRKLSKIATSIKNLGIKESKARQALSDIFDSNNDIGIEQIYSEQFELRYDEKKINRNIESVAEYLEVVMSPESETELTGSTVVVLKKLRQLIDKALRG